MSTPTASSRQPKRFRSFSIILSVLTVLMLVTGAVYQTLSVDRDRLAFPMPGRLIDVGGYKMHIDCAGNGSPAVILDAGMGDTYVSWRKVQPQIAQFTQVCSYDRAGSGYSDSSPHPRTSQVFAEELHVLLQRAAIPPPYILVGHSIAGFDVRLFTSIFRNEVAGMVLVDASHPEQTKRFPAAVNDMDASWLREEEFFEFTMPFGLPRLMGFCGSNGAVRAADCTFRSLRESVAEMKSISKSSEEVSACGSLGGLPLAVLSQDPNAPQYSLPEDLVKPTNDAWQGMQNELAQLSTRSTHVIAKGSGHYIQLDRPEVVIDAVSQVVIEARTSLRSDSTF